MNSLHHRDYLILMILYQNFSEKTDFYSIIGIFWVAKPG